MSSSNLAASGGTPTPDKPLDMFSYLYPSLKYSSEVDSELQFNQPALPFMSDKDIAKLLKVRELQRLNPIILIIYDIVYDLTNYNDHPGGKKILKKYNGTDCTQIFIDIGHNVDSLRYDINWKQCVIGRYLNSSRNNSNNTHNNTSSRTNSSNRQSSNFSIASGSLYSDSIYNQRANSEMILEVDENNMLRKEVIMKHSNLKSNIKNLLKMFFWILLLILSHVLFG
ncbi:hypothetical protein ACO0SA_000162 [Hanseniaspora valbyensis]